MTAQRPARQWTSKLAAFPGGVTKGDPFDAVSLPAEPRSTTSIAYASPLTLTRNVAMTPALPTVVGIQPRYFYVQPSLPAGLSLHNGTGAISGTPTAASGATDYTVTAVSGSDPRTARITITVT